MTPRIKSVVLSLGLAALVAGCGHPSNISKEPEHGIANGKMESMLDSKPDSPVHTIVMPHDEPVFPPGPGHDEFVTACVVCQIFHASPGTPLRRSERPTHRFVRFMTHRDYSLDPGFSMGDSRVEGKSNINRKPIERKSSMNRKRIIRIAQVTLAAVAAFTLTGQAEARNHLNKLIVVRPADLPELARVTGQAMMLHATEDGRTFLYIEQNRGARLAIFDVTDPAHVKEEGSAQVGAPGSFDFVSSLGDNAELVRFRHGQGEAVLDLHKVKVPTLNTIQGLDSQGSTERLGDDGFIIANQPNLQSGANDANYQVVDISNPLHPNRVADVEQVREKITNDETGTTFLLTADGLYLIRRPGVEEEHDIHEWQMSHPG